MKDACLVVRVKAILKVLLLILRGRVIGFNLWKLECVIIAAGNIIFIRNAFNINCVIITYMLLNLYNTLALCSIVWIQIKLNTWYLSFLLECILERKWWEVFTFNNFLLFLNFLNVTFLFFAIILLQLRSNFRWPHWWYFSPSLTLIVWSIIIFCPAVDSGFTLPLDFIELDHLFWFSL